MANKLVAPITPPAASPAQIAEATSDALQGAYSASHGMGTANPRPATSLLSFQSGKNATAGEQILSRLFPTQPPIPLPQPTPCPDTWQPMRVPSVPTAAVGHCTPQCTWKCETPVCDEVCEPVCKPPRCETRCATADISGCSMQCDQPQCAVMCPERQCATMDCPTCTTNCTEPICTLKCPSHQPCRNLCEQPECDWQCRKPESCPQPTCSMVCEQPKACGGTTHQALPPLAAGEVSVQSFQAPSHLSSASALQRTSQRLHVPVRRAKLTSHDSHTPHLHQPYSFEHSLYELPVMSHHRHYSEDRGSAPAWKI